MDPSIISISLPWLQANLLWLPSQSPSPYRRIIISFLSHLQSPLLSLLLTVLTSFSPHPQLVYIIPSRQRSQHMRTHPAPRNLRHQVRCISTWAENYLLQSRYVTYSAFVVAPYMTFNQGSRCHTLDNTRSSICSNYPQRSPLSILLMPTTKRSHFRPCTIYFCFIVVPDHTVHFNHLDHDFA